MKNRGITLIALIVTIVVLLILTAVSINMLTGENGIIKQAVEAKVETRAGNVEDEIKLWKSDLYLAKQINDTAESENDMIGRLSQNNLITDDDEVDKENKVIKIREKTELSEKKFHIN